MSANDGIIAAYANTVNSTSPLAQSIAGPLTVSGLLTPSAGVSTQAVAGGYLGQSIAPEVNSNTVLSLTTAYGYLTRVYVPVTGLSTYLDIIITSTSATNAIWGLYTGTGVAPVAYTAESHATITGTAGLYSIPWVNTVTLTPGFYYVYQELTGTSPTMPGVLASSTGSIAATIMNPNCSLSATVPTLNSAQLTSGAPTTISASTTLAWGTSWALCASKLWYGIR